MNAWRVGLLAAALAGARAATAPAEAPRAGLERIVGEGIPLAALSDGGSPVLRGGGFLPGAAPPVNP